MTTSPPEFGLPLWEAVDRRLIDALSLEDAVLETIQLASREAGLPEISVSPPQGRFLQLMARILGARAVLEIGTLGGYSTIWLARGLAAGGKVVTIELDPHHARVAAANFLRAGLSDVIELRTGRALDVLAELSREQRGPFDLIFIDADKVNTAAYFAWALRLSRRGALIVVDNVVRKGAIIDPTREDENVRGVQRFLEALAAEPRVSATALQTVGLKGYDGLALALVLDPPR